MLTYTTQNIFDSHADACIIPVSPSGKTYPDIEEDWKKRFPYQYEYFKSRVELGCVKPKTLLTVEVETTGLVYQPIFLIVCILDDDLCTIPSRAEYPLLKAFEYLAVRAKSVIIPQKNCLTRCTVLGWINLYASQHPGIKTYVAI